MKIHTVQMEGFAVPGDMDTIVYINGQPVMTNKVVYEQHTDFAEDIQYGMLVSAPSETYMDVTFRLKAYRDVLGRYTVQDGDPHTHYFAALRTLAEDKPHLIRGIEILEEAFNRG